MARNSLTRRKLRLFTLGYKRSELIITLMTAQPRYSDYMVGFADNSLIWHVRVEGGKVWKLGVWPYGLEQDYWAGRKLFGILTH